MPFPFEVDFREVQNNLDVYVDEVFACLESDFLTMSRGPGFVEYATFEKGYEVLKRATESFSSLTPEIVTPAVLDTPICLIVLRTMIGFTPPEWAFIAARQTGTEIPQGSARTIDRNIRLNPEKSIKRDNGVTLRRIHALIRTACTILSDGAPAVPPDKIHRLSKADTATGLDGIKSLTQLGVPYSMLLYERFLGRPFAGHRDSISELVGNIVENLIEDVLSRAGVSFRKTKRAERVPGFDQTPDFIIPDEFNPQIVIEAKLTEDDGTARDKVTRVQHLGELSMESQPKDRPKFEVVACIAGRGFGVRRSDMKKLLLATSRLRKNPLIMV